MRILVLKLPTFTGHRRNTSKVLGLCLGLLIAAQSYAQEGNEAQEEKGAKEEEVLAE